MCEISAYEAIIVDDQAKPKYRLVPFMLREKLERQMYEVSIT